LVEDGKNGFLFEPGNAHDLTEKIEYLHKDPNKILEMGKYARKCAEKKYISEKHYSRLIAIYKKAIDQKRDLQNNEKDY